VSRLAAPFVLLALAARPAAAQLPRYLGVDVGVSSASFQSTAPGGGEKLSGFAGVGHWRIVLRPVSIDVAYAQGRLSADTGSAVPRALVEGSVFATYRPVPWFALKTGPHVRAFAATGGTERWMLWEGRAHADAPLLDGEWQAYGELWVALASSVNVTPGAGGARGAEAGLTLKLPRSPVWARLAYAVDQMRLKNDARTESLQSVALTLGFGGR
jgi:hypothetical protein